MKHCFFVLCALFVAVPLYAGVSTDNRPGRKGEEISVNREKKEPAAKNRSSTEVSESSGQTEKPVSDTDAEIDILQLPVRDIRARELVLKIKYQRTSLEELKSSYKNWLGSDQENKAVVDLTEKYVKAGSTVTVTPEEWDRLEESNHKISLFLNGGREKPASENRFLKNRKITELSLPVFEIDARYWAWRIAEAKDVTFEQIAGSSLGWVGERSYNARLVSRIEENLKTGNTRKLTDLEQKKLDEMFEYLETYRNSLTDGDEIEKAERLITYFSNNRKGLIPYNQRNLQMPDSPKNLEYRNLGTMENHIWSVIARRMKHNHACWSIRGGNHLAKILAKKCSGRLNEVADKLKKPAFEYRVVEQIKEQILSAYEANRKIGKGYRYPTQGSIPYVITQVKPARQAWMSISGIMTN